MSSLNTFPSKRRGRPPKVKETPAPAPQPQGEGVVSIPPTELYPFPNHPFKVRDDDAATILMVDSNIQRENILPSERAQAYKLKLETIKRRTRRPTKKAENFGEFPQR